MKILQLSPFSFSIRDKLNQFAISKQTAKTAAFALTAIAAGVYCAANYFSSLPEVKLLPIEKESPSGGPAPLIAMLGFGILGILCAPHQVNAPRTRQPEISVPVLASRVGKPEAAVRRLLVGQGYSNKRISKGDLPSFLEKSGCEEKQSRSEIPRSFGSRREWEQSRKPSRNNASIGRKGHNQFNSRPHFSRKSYK